MSVFDYARRKITGKYLNSKKIPPEYVEDFIRKDLTSVRFYEDKSKRGMFCAIKYGIKALIVSLTEDEKLVGHINLCAWFYLAILLLCCFPHMATSEFILTVSKICLIAFVVSAVWFITDLFKKRPINIVLCIFMALYLLLSTPYIPVLFGYKTTQIGDFYEAKSYTEKYYVIMSREPEYKSSRKAYTLPALIERDLEHATEYDEYHINYLYFPNGGYLTFDTCEPEHNDIYPNEEENVYDYRGDEYYITLTKQKVK